MSILFVVVVLELQNRRGIPISPFELNPTPNGSGINNVS
jgi:hypothetical protein